MSERTGVRAMPVALQLGFVLAFATAVGEGLLWTFADEPWRSQRYILALGGAGFASEVLLLAGFLELRRRLTGRAAIGCAIAAVGQALVLTSNVGWMLLTLKSGIFEHRWLFEVNQYVHFANALIVVVGVALAASERSMPIAIGVVVICVLMWPPPVLAKPLYSWMPEGKTGLLLQYLLMSVRIVAIVVAVALVAKEGPTDRYAAQAGLRSLAKALWLRVIAAITVVLLTLMVASGGGRGGIEVVKFATIVGALVNILALVLYGLGALRAARASLPELGRYNLVAAGACALWAAGVSLDQFPYIYRAFYGGGGDFGGESLQEMAQALTIALPLVTITSVALVAIAIAGLAAHRNAMELRAHAQGKGVGAVIMMLASMAVQAWLLTKAESLGSFAAMSLMIAGLGLAATVLMARLCGLAADELDRDATLPTATVVP